jgi:uncharacterized protein YdiU (UPF0061 family)
MADTVPDFHPEDPIAAIADFIGDPVMPATFPAQTLRWRNDRAAATIGLAGLSDAEWIDRFARFVPFAGSLPRPLALRYHGHQFGTYNPELGDGRGFLYAQARDTRGRLLDMGTKGSGQTPYSRSGDGRLTLKGAVREVLATEMLSALGVDTSRTLSVVETGEQLHRGDEPSPTRSAVLVRLSHGHIRIGSSQRLFALGAVDHLTRLTDYCLKVYYDDHGGDDAPVRLLRHVADATGRLAASYMVAGFVHGVLNTDNINISGESFDYGPWRFAPSFDTRFTAAYFDHNGLYAYGRQPGAIYWNVQQLAQALSPIADAGALADAASAFVPAYREALTAGMLWRLGVEPRGAADDVALVQAIERALVETQVPLDGFWFDWAGGRLRRDATAYLHPDFANLAAALAHYAPARSLDAPYWSGEAPCAMLIDEVEAIWSPIAERDDWSAFHAKVDAIRGMGTAYGAR